MVQTRKQYIRFLGGASTVTGSKYLVSNGSNTILIDCGMFQGLKSLRLKNWDEFPIDPAKIDAILLTHAHLDHSGYIPRLITSGFRGKIFTTAATKDLCQILLPDAGYLAEEEAEYLNRHNRTKHKPALPLFTLEQAEKSIEYFQTVKFNTKFSFNKDVSFEFRYAGHILGAASIILTMDNVTTGFSGDVGRQKDPIFYPPRQLPPVDYLVVESTYGNRKHSEVDPIDELEKCIVETASRGGTVVIPSFAVGRVQSLLYYLWKLRTENRIPKIPMYLNSPMATNVNAVWSQYHDLHRLNGQE
jgi:metallo-beta-lactamase family protein